MQIQVQYLQTDNVWLTSQREALEKVATKREQDIAILTSCLLDSEAILNKIRNNWGCES